ncbi:hypothetical protein BHQ15_14215 [Mycolicibacillus koreensis]|nr:hypothetical protein BHQ15_14215 [Mycolicibacillus koreensis]
MSTTGTAEITTTAAVDLDSGAPEPTGTPIAAVAPWSARATAFAVDALVGLGVAGCAALAWLTTPGPGPWWWIWLGVLGVSVLAVSGQRVLVAAVTGWTLGRRLVGVRVTGPGGAPVGPGRLLARELAHLLDTLPLPVGWFWPLWDGDGRTVADLLTATRVHPVVPRPPAPRRAVLIVLAVASGLCVATAATSYLLVYRQENAVEQARAEISRAGPQLMVDLLSYSPDTLDEDFARAAGLTTPAYRDELDAAQQQARENPARHTYIVPNSAVLSASPQKASMLIYLRGEIGEPPAVWISTATAQVQFVRDAGRWLIDGATIFPNSRPEAPPPPEETPKSQKPGSQKPESQKPKEGGR